MSDSISEILKLKELFEAIKGLPIVNVDPASLLTMDPDCLVRKPPVGRFAKSVANFGICTPILVNCNNLVLDGRKRLEIAITIGMKSVPVKRLNREITASEARSIRVISNPDSRPPSGKVDMLSGKSQKLPVKRHLDRAKRTANARANIDLRLQNENKIYEASLAQAALYAVHSIGCLDAIIRNMKGGEDDLLEARKLLEKAIRYTIRSGIRKTKDVGSSSPEITEEEQKNDQETAGKSSLLELPALGDDLRDPMRCFGSLPGLQLQ